jgi:transcriptional regulator with XRE-family HTH domain
MPPTMRPRGDVIHHLRESNGDSLRTLASRAGIDPATLLRIENGTSYGRPATLKAIAEALAVPLPVIVEAPAEAVA